jgi:triphosphatase
MPNAAAPHEPSETELKLQVDARQLQRLKRRKALVEAPVSRQRLENIYFDTPDRLLHRHKMALRLRRADGRWLQTLKTAGTEAGAMSRRGEWETPAKATKDGRGRLDLRRLHDSPLVDLLGQSKAKPNFQPWFATRVQRTLWTVERGQAQIEVALDVGDITAQFGAKRRREPIRELELELKRGEAVALIELALDLIDIPGNAPLELLPLARSKAERGYQLALGRPAAAVKASAKGFTEKLTGRMSSAHALRAVVAHGLAVVTGNCELLLRGDDSEYVHQARVALRRIRSAIRLFDRARNDVPESLIDELRWLGSALGAARDWDVFVDEVLPKLQKTVGAEVITDPLRAKADQRRHAQRAKLRSDVHSPRYAALLLNGERWTMSPAPADSELLQAMAETTLQRSAKKLFKPARFFAALTPERRHRVRIQAKRLRYALDLFSVMLPKRATARYIDATAELQDLLGGLNDAAVARTMFLQLGKAAKLPKAVDQWFIANECEQLRQVEVRLMTLAEMPASWQ